MGIHKASLIVLVSLIALGQGHAAPTPSRAQVSRREGEQIRRLPIKTAPKGTSDTLKSAQADGYEGRPKDLKPGSLLAGGIAVVPGSIVHGLGHFYLGEYSTGWALLLSEIVGIGLMASSFYLQKQSSHRPELTKLLSHSGMILFSGSWLADIIGTFKGSAPLATGELRRQTSRFGLAYRYSDDEIMPFNHHLNARLNLSAGPVYLRPGLDLEVGLKRREIQLDTGVWLFSGRNTENFLALGTELNRTENQVDGWARNALLTYFEGQLDVGQFIKTLRHFYIYSRMGYGFARYQLSTREDNAPGLFANGTFWDQWLHLETGLALFIVETTHIALSVVQTPMSRVPPHSLINIGIFSPELETFKFDLKYGYATDIGIHLQVLVGDGFNAGIGLEYTL